MTQPAGFIGTLLSAYLVLLSQTSIAFESESVSAPSAGNLSIMSGVDYWQMHSSSASEDDYNRKLLYLPDTANVWDYKNPHAWARISGNYEFSSNIGLNYKFRADQAFGNRVDELNFDYAISPILGFRLGVLDYKTSWCKNYELESAWIREPDIFCTVRGASVITGGAPGIQSYSNFELGNYRIQTAVGLYNPMLFDYDKGEFSNVFGYKGEKPVVQKNRRFGISVNALNLVTGSEIRVGYNKADQRGVDSVNSTIRNNVDVLYLGYSKSITPSFWVTLTHAIFNPNNTIDNDQWGQAKLFDSRKSTTLEFVFRQDARNVLAAGFSQHNIKQDFHDFDGTYYGNAWSYRYLNKSIAWRHQFSNNFFMVMQNTWVRQHNGTPDTQYLSDGKAFGMRLGYVY